MKKKIVNTFFSLILLLMLSNSTFGQTEDFTKYLIPKDKIGVHNSNFKLNGYYYNKQIRVDDEKDTIRAILPLMFYKNGTRMGYDLIGKNKEILEARAKNGPCFLRPKQDFETIHEFIQCKMGESRKRMMLSVYSVDKSIIRIQSLIGTKHFFESRGVVLNDSMYVINKRINYITKEVRDAEDVFYFRRAQKPDSIKFTVSKTIDKFFFKE